MSDVSAFKKLYSAMINNGGNLSKVQSEFKDASGKVKKIKCFVKESFPYFLATDNHFYVPCYFTKKAVDDFKSKHSGINITDLNPRLSRLENGLSKCKRSTLPTFSPHMVELKSD